MNSDIKDPALKGFEDNVTDILKSLKISVGQTLLTVQAMLLLVAGNLK